MPCSAACFTITAVAGVAGVLAAYPEIATAILDVSPVAVAHDLHPDLLSTRYAEELGLPLVPVQHRAGRRTRARSPRTSETAPSSCSQAMTAGERDELRRGLPEVLAWAESGVRLVRDLFAKDPELYAEFGRVPSSLLSIVAPDGKLDLYDGVLRARDAEGVILFDGVKAADYETKLRENVRSWSYMKFPFMVDIGLERGWYKVGPLARLQNCDAIGTPRAEAARQEWLATSPGHLIHAPLSFHWARMIELLYAAEVIEALLDDPALLAEDLVASGPRGRSGVGIIEAPRGTLIHHYEVDEHDLVTMCNLIVSTTHNNQAMNEAIREVARQYLDGHEPTEGLLNRVEVAIRAFDPCLSCATHALGKMPLAIEIVDVHGAVTHRLVKDCQ